MGYWLLRNNLNTPNDEVLVQVYLKWLEKTLETTNRLKKPSDEVLMKILELQNKSSRVSKIMKEIPPTPEDLNRTKKLPSHVAIDEHDHKV